MKDAFDLWWQWAEKPLDSMLMIGADIHYPIMELSPDERRDREKVSTRPCVGIGKVRSAGPKPHRPTRDLRHAADRRAVKSPGSINS
jgi:hypothetical protein